MPVFTEVRREAEEGHVVSQGYLGWAYLYGHDTEIDYQEALRWLTAAAEAGAARPWIHLGRIYEEGLGVPRDINEAIRRSRRYTKLNPGQRSRSPAFTPKVTVFPRIRRKP
jgi:TPR repeat protein